MYGCTENLCLARTRTGFPKGVTISFPVSDGSRLRLASIHYERELYGILAEPLDTAALMAKIIP